MIVKILISQRTYTRFLFVYLRKQLAETIDRLGFKGEMRVFLKLCPVENRLLKSNFYILIHKKNLLYGTKESNRTFMPTS